MTIGGGRGGGDVLTDRHAMPQQEVQFNAAQGFDGDHPHFGRHNSSAFFADMPHDYATYLQLVPTASCSNRCCEKYRSCVLL